MYKCICLFAAGVSIEEANYDIRYIHVLHVDYVFQNMILQCYFLIGINLVLFMMCTWFLNFVTTFVQRCNNMGPGTENRYYQKM